MKKALLVLGLVISMMFVAGCSNDDDKGRLGGGLPNVPEVNEIGSLNATRGGEIVTQDDLENLAEELLGALGLEDILRSVRARGENRLRRLEVYELELETITEYGKHGGRAEATAWLEVGADQSRNVGYMKGTLQIVIHDFSENGKLFLGGALGASFYMYYSTNEAIMEGKINGTVNFNGTFQGAIEFRNLHANITENNRGSNYSLNGDIVVVSGGNTFSLKDYIGEDLLDMFQ